MAKLLPFVDGTKADIPVFCLFEEKLPELLASLDIREFDWLRLRTNPFCGAVEMREARGTLCGRKFCVTYLHLLKFLF